MGARICAGLALLAVIVLVVSDVASAHDPVDLLASPGLDEAGLLLMAALPLWAYIRGVRMCRPGRLPRWRVASFIAALTALAASLAPPVDELASELFAAHMVQHAILISVVAPLLQLGRAFSVITLGAPRRLRSLVTGPLRVARGAQLTMRVCRSPLAAWTLHVGGLWAWHAPPLYEAALGNPIIHVLEHVSLLGTGLLFWWVVTDSAYRRRLGATGGLLYLFAAGLQGTMLGALITLSERAWYPSHAETARRWGVSAIADQQLAGAIMWVPVGVIYLAAGLALLGSHLRAAEARSE